MKKEAEPMILDVDTCYAALVSHDSRFDGRFFIGVSSTGIYCRPICRVKLPRKENCSFFANAASAEAEGFRPCLKCRPELAPGSSSMDSVSRIARKAASLIEEGYLDDHNLPDLAEFFAITDRHLRRSFFSEFGVSPVQYLQTIRLLLAKNLLTDTSVSMTEVAIAAGFGSIRRFNDLFRKHYRLTPGDLRKKWPNLIEKKDEIKLSVSYRPPYAWDKILSFLAARAIPGVESVASNTYNRTVLVRRKEKVYRGWISVTNSPKRNSLSLTMSSSLLPVLSPVLARVRALFDTNCDPVEIYEKLRTMNAVSPQLPMSGIRLPGCFEPFEMSIRAILGQQITVKAARTLALRFSEKFGEKIETPWQDLSLTFPEPEMICDLPAPIADHLGPLGITRTRAGSILALAKAMTLGSINLYNSSNPLNEMEKLLELPGFGPWTVQYIGMRAMGWPDAFPHTDYGVKKALANIEAKEILVMAKKWQPWRSYATINLWNSLEGKK